MIKNIAIVSLSSGILGEPFIKFELDLGLRRLNEYGINVKFMPHALKGLDYVKAHPEKRADELIAAFRDDGIDMIYKPSGKPTQKVHFKDLFGRLFFVSDLIL